MSPASRQVYCPVMFETSELNYDHWALVVVNFESKRLEFWEPLFGGSHEARNDSTKILGNIWQFLLWEQTSRSEEWGLDQWAQPFIAPVISAELVSWSTLGSTWGLVGQSDAGCGLCTIMAAAFLSMNLNPRLAAPLSSSDKQVVWLAIQKHESQGGFRPSKIEVPHRTVPELKAEEMADLLGSQNLPFGPWGPI